MPAGLAYLASRRAWRFAAHLRLIHARLMDVAARRIRRLMIWSPPRHGKSTLVSLYFPTWWMLRWPDQEVILTSYEATYASTWGMRCRDLFDAWGPTLYGPGRRVRRDRRAAADWRILGRSGGMRTAGVGTGVTGRGGDLIIIDDPVKDAAQAASAVRRDAAWEWYQSTLYTRQEPDAALVVVMTRWHLDDLAGRLLTAGGEPWTVLRLPALADDPADPLGRTPGEALWPDRYSAAALEEIRSALTEYWWSSLYQQDPVPAEGTILDRAWWRYYDGDPRNVAQTADEVLQSWDMTFKAEGSSYVVGQVWARSGADRYLLHQVRDRLSFPETLDAMRALSAAWGGTVKLIEEAANGPAVIDTLRNEIPGIQAVPPRGSKEDRANGAAFVVRAGRVYLPTVERAPWVAGFVDEAADFPRGLNDDQVDAASQALLWFGRGSVGAQGIDLGLGMEGTTEPSRWRIR